MADQLLDELRVALGDAYSIERELAGGGMSRVFVAREQALGREVVVKVLPPELAAGMNHERFRREVQLAAGLVHPCIVPLLTAGEAGNLLWFTMPFIQGESLKQRLESGGNMGVAEVVGLLRDVAEALTFAHSRGVIHRDIKPGNILSDGKRAQVTDFGVAKALGAALPIQGVAGHTTSGMAIGTPAYMAPEQLAADPSADHRVDIYAMGLLAYELLTGDSPFSAPSPTATMAAQLTRVPEPLEKVRGDVPLALSRLVARCLDKDPEGRPADAREVLTELDQISGAIAADRHRLTAEHPSAVSPPAAPQWPLLVSAVAVIALIAVGLVWSQRTAAPPISSAAADTVYLPSPLGDSSEAVALPFPDQPMSRDDSLAIAAALRDELDQLEADQPPVEGQVVLAYRGDDLGALPLERQLSMADSLIRTRLREFRVISENPDLRRVGEALADVAIAEGISVVRQSGQLSNGEGPKQRVLLAASRSLSETPEYSRLAEAVIKEVDVQLGRTGNWEVVRQPSGIGTVTRDNDIDVALSVGVSPAAGDSVTVRISLRNTSAGSAYGFHVVASEPMSLNGGRRGYSTTVRESVAMMEYLRGLESGDQWRFDMGRQVPREGAGPSRSNRPSPPTQP